MKGWQNLATDVPGERIKIYCRGGHNPSEFYNGEDFELVAWKRLFELDALCNNELRDPTIKVVEYNLAFIREGDTSTFYGGRGWFYGNAQDIKSFQKSYRKELMGRLNVKSKGCEERRFAEYFAVLVVID